MTQNFLTLTKQATFAKNIFYSTRIIAIIGAALLPILVTLSDNWKTTTIVVSILVTLPIALEEAIKYKERYLKLEGLVLMVNN